MAVSFETDIKPYFSSTDREHMNSEDYYYNPFDLWSASTVCGMYDRIRSAIEDGRMPPDDGENGPWPPEKIKAFLTIFDEWKKGGCQP